MATREPNQQEDSDEQSLEQTLRLGASIDKNGVLILTLEGINIEILPDEDWD